MSQIDTYCVYGISIASDYPFQYPLIRTNKPADVVFSCTTKPPAKVPKSVLSQDNILTVKTPHCQRTVFVSELADDSYVLQFRDYLVFWVRPDSITAYIQNLPDPSILEMLFFGPALALWRFTHGLLGLHAAVTAIDDKAIMFSAYNKSGKSSLAASCLQAGHALLADDYAAINQVDGSYYVEPGYPLMRMWEDQAAYFTKKTKFQVIKQEPYPQQLTPIGTQGFGLFCDQPKPLQLIYIPQRRDTKDSNTNIDIQPVTKSTAVTALMRSGAVTYYRRWFPLHKQNLSKISELVTRVPVRMVNYPSGYDLLTKVRDTILEDVRKLNI